MHSLEIGYDKVLLPKISFEVKMGEKIGTADIKLIEEKGYPLHSAVLITNMQEIEDMEAYTGEAHAGETKMISYKKK